MEPKPHLLTFPLIITLLSSISAGTSTAAGNNYKKYLKTACNSTLYPKLCYNSLSSYTSIIKTNDLTLCSTALNVSLQAAINTSNSLTYVVSRLGKTEAQVIGDCVDEIGDSVDELKQSLDVLCNLNLNYSSDLRFQVSNVQTWVSAAITDEDTCLDGFDDEIRVRVRASVKKMIKKVVLNLAMMTSNALALINKLHSS
ncbi:pectinesterase inhibitor 10-like [Euphorbia lathyris]|uniref:pectinesterase inhibitor 10-like n=1 Tax=Euphorbia lathyris TaxID=212925 RepID=UPI003313E5B6